MNEKDTTKDSKVKFQNIGLLVLVVVVFLVVLLQVKYSIFSPVTITRLEKGVAAPDFTFPDLNGKMVSLSDFRGKVVFLNIWATWCPSCVDEMPSMEKLYQEMKGEDFEILAVSIDVQGAKIVIPFMEKYKLSFPALIDSRGRIKSLYQTTGVPETFIIDKEGIIVLKIIGPRDWSSADAFRYFRNLLLSNQP